jgi:hypothetical protein
MAYPRMTDQQRRHWRLDRDHTLKFGDEGWMVAHRGWVVTQIERLPAPAAPPASAGFPAPA